MKKLLLLLFLSLGLSLSSYAGNYICTSPNYFDDGTTINVYQKTSNGYLDKERGEMFNVNENEHLISMSYNTVTEDYGAGISAVIINKNKMKFIKSATVFLVPLNPSLPSIYDTQHSSGECVYVN